MEVEGTNSATRVISIGWICVGFVKTMCAQQQKQSSPGFDLESFWGASSQNACDQKSTTRRSYAAELSISSAANIITLRQDIIEISDFEFITGRIDTAFASAASKDIGCTAGLEIVAGLKIIGF